MSYLPVIQHFIFFDRRGRARPGHPRLFPDVRDARLSTVMLVRPGQAAPAWRLIRLGRIRAVVGKAKHPHGAHNLAADPRKPRQSPGLIKESGVAQGSNESRRVREALGAPGRARPLASPGQMCMRAALAAGLSFLA